MREVSLALGGGGIKGIAHVGVIRKLEQSGFKIKAIAGTSAGGVVGSIFAAGYSTDQIQHVITGIDQTSIFQRQKHDGPALLGLKGLTQALSELLGNKTIEDMVIPFACTAVDLNTGREVVFTNGRAVDAVLATVAVPGIFPPKEIGKSTLVDGGVLDPVPVLLARFLAPRLPVIAVCLSPSQEYWAELPALSFPSTTSLPRPILDQFERLRLARAFNIFVRSIETSSCMLAELRMAVDKPDIIVRPKLAGYSILDRVNPDVLIRLGEEAVEDELVKILQKTSWIQSIFRKIRPVTAFPYNRGQL